MNWLETTAIIIGLFMNVGILIGGLLQLRSSAKRLEHIIDRFSVEHEIIMHWYAESKNITLDDLPTRMGRASWWKKE